MKNKYLIIFFALLLISLSLSICNVEARSTEKESSGGIVNNCSGSNVTSAVCTYTTLQAGYSIMGKYNKGSFVWDYVYSDTLKHVDGADVKFTTENSEVSSIFKNDDYGKQCPEKMYVNSKTPKLGHSSTAYTVELKTKYPGHAEENGEEIFYLNSDKSSVQCAQLNEDPVTSNKEVEESNSYKCDNSGTYTIIKYKDGTWGATGNEDMNNVIVDGNIFNSKKIYKLNNIAVDGVVRFATEVTPAQQRSYTSLKCNYVGKLGVEGEITAVIDEDSKKEVEKNCTGLIGGGDFIKWVQWAFNLIKIIGPVLALVLGMVDFIKAAASGEDDAKKKATKDVKNRIIAAALLFLVPSIVQLLLSLSPNLGNDPTCGIK